MPAKTTKSSTASRSRASRKREGGDERGGDASANVMIIAGSDEGRVKQEAREVAARWAPAEAGEFGCEVIDGQVEGVDQAVGRIHETLGALETLPFFGEKLVWLKSVNFLGDNVMGRSDRVLGALESLMGVLVRGVDPRVRFLVSATPVDKRRSFFKNAGKVGQVVVFDAFVAGGRDWEVEAARYIQEQARAKGFRFSPEALEHFVGCTVGDSTLIASELEKLSLAVGESEVVDLELARVMVARTQAGVVFELGNAFAARDLPRALRLVDQLLFHGEQPITILLAAMIPTVRNLLAVKVLCAEYGLRGFRTAGDFAAAMKRLPEEAAELLPRKKDGTVNLFGVGYVAVHAGRFELRELQNALQICVEANLRLVTTQLDGKSVLDHALVRCLARS